MAAVGAVPFSRDAAPTRPALRRGLRRAERRRTVLAALLVAPSAVFLLVNFAAPIALLLTRGFVEREIPEAWPATTQALRQWDGSGLPPGSVVATFIDELRATRSTARLSGAANRLNYDVPGLRSLLMRTAATLPAVINTDPLEALVAIDARWGEREIWAAMRRAADNPSSFYFLAAFDRRLDANGDVQRVPDDQAIFVALLARTFWISAVVAALCALLGYPLAYVIAHLRDRPARVLLILVLLPFWTSVLVRTSAWMVLLQERGLINDLLLSLGLIASPLELIYNRVGVYIAMTHVLLPYFVLPLYSVMKRVHPLSLRAALSLGASPTQAFWRVYFPQTLAGAGAGALIVFILALGYYITPALVGGADDQMISHFIAFYTNQSLNWGMAAALSLVLLGATLLLLLLYGRIVGRHELAMR